MSVKVRGLSELIRAADAAGGQTKKLVRDDLREAAVPVRDDAARRFAPVDAGSAASYGISVRKTGVVSVEQRRRRTTGLHPEFGALQMRRALIPALVAQEPQVQRRMEKAVDRICDRFEAMP